MVLVPEHEFDIDAVRAAWVGRPLGRSVGRYPVEHDPIRRFCHMTGERTAVSLDPDAAARSPWGRVVCPPTFVRYFAGNGPWPPPDRPEPGTIPAGVPRLGEHGVNLGTTWSWRRAVLVGDRLHADWTVEDVFVKPTRLDPRSVWIRTSATVRDQDDEIVAVWGNTVLFHRPAPAQLAAPPARQPDGAVSAFTVDLTPTAMTLQVSGAQDWNLVHHDDAHARAAGHASIFTNTTWTQGLLGRIVAEHIGDRPWRPAELAFRMVGMNRPGDRVTAWYRETGDGELEIGLARGDAVTATGTATVHREPGPGAR